MGDTLRAVIEPERESSEKADDFSQVEREIVTISEVKRSEPCAASQVMDIPCARVATKKYWPDGCHTAEQSCWNSGDLLSKYQSSSPEQSNTHSLSATAGIIPSIVLSIFGSDSDTFQTRTLPSAPEVV